MSFHNFRNILINQYPSLPRTNLKNKYQFLRAHSNLIQSQDSDKLQQAIQKIPNQNMQSEITHLIPVFMAYLDLEESIKTAKKINEQMFNEGIQKIIEDAFTSQLAKEI